MGLGGWVGGSRTYMDIDGAGGVRGRGMRSRARISRERYVRRCVRSQRLNQVASYACARASVPFPSSLGIDLNQQRRGDVWCGVGLRYRCGRAVINGEQILSMRWAWTALLTSIWY